MPPRRRFILVAMIALLLGAVTNLALAWALAARGPIPDLPPMAGGVFMQWDKLWSTYERKNAGALVLGWAHADGMYVSLPPSGSLRARIEAARRAREMTPEDVHAELLKSQERLLIERPGFAARNAPPRWGTFAMDEPPDELTGAGADWAFGWPAKSMWCRIRSMQGWNRVSGGEIDGGILLSGAPSAVMRDFRVLPLWPKWSGAIINTIFFALIWMALLLGPGVIRRRRRVRRGCCASCGYDLRGSASARCPECGEEWRIEKRSMKGQTGL